MSTMSIWFLGFTKEDYHLTFEDLEPFIRPYVEEKHKLKGLDPESVTEQDVAKFRYQLKIIWAVGYTSTIILIK